MLNAASISRFGAAKPLEALSAAEMTALLTDLAAGRLTGFPGRRLAAAFFFHHTSALYRRLFCGSTLGWQQGGHDLEMDGLSERAGARF